MPAKVASKPASTRKKYTAFMCSHTHWDREWYGSFQQFRIRLVRLIDQLMDILDANPDFRCFNLDGQTVVLEDYLEVMPQQRARLEKFIRDGRIVIGPWYILPDEWLVSGEATVRNMLRGQAICREFGVAGSRVGYLPDMFGHISQIPQILAGFGLDNTIFWRGLSGDQWMSEMWWESPDGTRVFAFHLPEYCGYCNAAFFYHSLPQEARTLEPEPNGWDMVNDNTEFCAKALRHVADRAIAKSHSNQLLFLNGVDHMPAQPQTPAIIDRANHELDDVLVKHASFEEFMKAVKSNTPAKKMQVVRGECRSTAVSKESGAIVLPNILSSRIHLKIANARCQTLLEKWTEPFSTAAAMVGGSYSHELILTAWKWLLRNHPHDSIGGCSIDDVHRQMETRFEWAEDIASTMANTALTEICAAIKTDTLPEDQLAFHLFNPLNWDVTDNVLVDIDVDESWLRERGVTIHPDNIYRSIRNIRIMEWDGSPVDYEILDLTYQMVHQPWRSHFGPLAQVVRFRVALAVRDLPALGYRGYRIGMVKKERRLDHRHGSTNPARMENQYLSVDIHGDGSMVVTNRITGITHTGLHYFEDGGDNGDGYTYSPPRHDAVVTSRRSRSQITRLCDSPALQSIAVDYELELPESVTHDRQHRSTRTITQKVRSIFRLGRDSRRVDVETTLINAAKDHRLRVCFDVAKAGDTHVAEMQFDVVERKNRIVQPDEEVWIEDMPLEQAQQDFVSYNNLALANFGLPEYELVEGAHENVLKITLLRAVNYLGAGIFPNTIVGGAGPHFETPEQQVLGRAYTFHYSIIPHSGKWARDGVQRQAHLHNAMWRGVTSTRHNGVLAGEKLSFVKVSGDNIMLSSIKRTECDERDYVVRFWNSNTKEQKATISWLRKPSGVWQSNLAEEKLDAVTLDKNSAAQIKVGPKKIITLRFRPKV